MNSYDISDKREAIISASWDYLLKTGLENADIGELCKETKLEQSSLCDWFENQDDIWIASGKFGLYKVVDAIFAFTVNHTDDVRRYFDTLLDEVEKYKYELRLAIQIITSPVFGERMREKSKDFRQVYEKYAEKIIAVFGCTNEQAESFIYTIIASVVDYVIWNDGEKTQMVLENLYAMIVEKIGVER